MSRSLVADLVALIQLNWLVEERKTLSNYSYNQKCLSEYGTYQETGHNKVSICMMCGYMEEIVQNHHHKFEISASKDTEKNGNVKVAKKINKTAQSSIVSDTQTKY